MASENGADWQPAASKIAIVEDLPFDQRVTALVFRQKDWGSKKAQNQFKERVRKKYSVLKDGKFPDPDELETTDGHFLAIAIDCRQFKLSEKKPTDDDDPMNEYVNGYLDGLHGIRNDSDSAKYADIERDFWMKKYEDHLAIESHRDIARKFDELDGSDVELHWVSGHIRKELKDGKQCSSSVTNL